MDFEKAKEIVKKAKEGAPNRESSLLVDGFEEFLSLSERHKETQEPKEKQMIAEGLELSRNKVWALLEKTAASFGFNMDQFQRYMDNASNFSPQQWQAMEAFRQEQINSKKMGFTPFMKREKRNRKLLKA
jgi:hypothetical protein